MSRRVLSVSGCFLVVFLSNGTTFGQKARLEGVVRDVSGGVLPGVEVSLISEASHLSSIVFSNDSGHCMITSLRPGVYTLSAELLGFKRSTRTGIQLDVGDLLSVDLELQPGDISQEIVVQSQSSQLDRVSQQIRSVVSERRIAALPLLTRNPLELFFLQPGTNRVAEGGADRVNGLRQTSSNVQIEGIASTDPFLTRGAAYSFAPIMVEAMSEYSVTTASATSDIGSGSGAQVRRDLST